MFKREQCHKIENIKVLQGVLKRLNDMFDPRDLYHHSNGGQICELHWFDNGREEGFEITFMGMIIQSQPLDDYYDDIDVVDFDNSDEIFKSCYNNIISKYTWMLSILEYSDVDIIHKTEIKNILTLKTHE